MPVDCSLRPAINRNKRGLNKNESEQKLQSISAAIGCMCQEIQVTALH